MSESEHDSVLWKLVWELPVIGEVIQTIVLFLPTIVLAFSGLVGDDAEDSAILFLIAIVEIAWLWALERFGRTRLVVPLVRLPWLWVFVLFGGYSLLVVAGVVHDPGV